MRFRSPIRRGVVAVLLAMAALLGAVATPAAASPERPRILFFGDSLLWEAHDVVRFFGGFRDVDIEIHAIGGTALCDWTDAITRALYDPAVDEVVIAFSGNNMTPCATDVVTGHGLQGKALGELYANDTARVMGTAPSGTPVLWVTAPTNPGPNPNGEAVRRATVASAASFPNARVIDGGQYITPGGVWSATQPCIYFEPCSFPTLDGVGYNVVRAPDGAHFCPTPYQADLVCDTYSSGALRYGLTILGPALEAVGL